MAGGDSAGCDDPSTGDPFTLERFSEFLAQAQWALFTFLNGILDDAEQARDLAQDTFCEAWVAVRRNTPPFVAGHSEREMRRWLFHVAYHRAISALRRRKVIAWESLETSEAVAPLAHSFEEQVLDRDSLRAALRLLSATDVACLVLIVLHQFTAAEVGAVIGATPAAVAKRFARAKERLRTVYLAQNGSPQTRTRIP
jgi:RNA polymerase sigma-70 factor (ECF subfamily)